jgi:hypothetical protein
MNEKINELLEQYKTSLERKQNLLQPYIDKKNDDDLFEPKWNIIDQENYSRLKAETEMLKRHIDDLEWIIKEGKKNG